MYGDRHQYWDWDSVYRQRFVLLATNLYGWPLRHCTEQYRLWRLGVRDIRIADATLCLMEMAEGDGDVHTLIRVNRVR